LIVSTVQPDTPQVTRPPIFRNRHKRFWIVLIAAVVLVAFYLPSLVAFRYTAAAQNTGFLTHPWRSWSFMATALTVPGDSRLKTSGNALRAADSRFHGSSIDPHEVRLLFLPEGRPYAFTHPLGSRTVTTTITPPYRFVWQVSGHIDTLNGPDTVVALLDYKSAKVLYDVRRDLPQGTGTTEPTDTSSASPSPSTTAPSPGATP
jgi:hypothetical protein